MIKKKLAKCNLHAPRKDPKVMKLGFNDNFTSRITETSKFKRVVQAIRSKLTRKLIKCIYDTFYMNSGNCGVLC